MMRTWLLLTTEYAMHGYEGRETVIGKLMLTSVLYPSYTRFILSRPTLRRLRNISTFTHVLRTRLCALP